VAYVQGFQHDVFVSYAHLDNEVLVQDNGHERGWVDALLDRLTPQLRSYLGTREVDLLVDHEFMRSNLPITEQILDHVRGSAVLLLVMSPGYLGSEWCRRERDSFLSVLDDRVSSGSVFVVRALPVEPGDEPAALRELDGFRFYRLADGAARRLGDPDDADGSFRAAIIGLANHLADHLRHVHGQATSAGGQAQPASRVYVARATDDLEERETQVRSALQQAGLEVLPPRQARYPTTDLAAFEAAMRRDLESCRLFVQLLSETRGRELDFAAGRHLPELQADLARRVGRPILQWRSRALTLDGVADPGHRALLEGAMACEMGEFTRIVAERAMAPPEPRAGPRRPQVLTVFVNADAVDERLAAEIREALATMDVDVYGVPAEGPPDEIRAAMESNLRDCDGLVLVYGRTRLDWVQQQLRLARKVSSSREQPYATLAIFEGPPPGKAGVAASIKNLVTLNLQRGLEREKLSAFVNLLRG